MRYLSHFTLLMSDPHPIQFIHQTYFWVEFIIIQGFRIINYKNLKQWQVLVLI